MALNFSTDGGVLLKERFRVQSEEPLPIFDSMPARAFAASDLRDTGTPTFALVCESNRPPRHDVFAAVRRVYHKNFVCVVDWGVVDWPADGRRRAVLVFERPGGGLVMSPGGGNIAPFRDDRIRRLILQPLTQVLLELHQQGVNHRNLHPENMFYDSPETDRANILLGDCLAAPAAIRQPAVYEPIEYALADPAGRGDATGANDLHALGVTVTALLQGHRPLAELTDEEMLARKMGQGSYAALIGERRVSVTMMEVLRGLLNDDPAERWSIEELEHWVGGRRLTPRQQVRPPKAARPFEVLGGEHHTAREVADAFSRHWDDAATDKTDHELDVWLRRSLNRDDRTEAVNLAKTSGSGSGANASDGRLARICIGLDPAAPIRLQRFRAMPAAIGPLLAAYYEDAEMRRLFGQVLSENLPLFWLELSLRPTPEHVRLVTVYERLRAVVGRSTMGQGIERALYELNPTMPCR